MSDSNAMRDMNSFREQNFKGFSSFYHAFLGQKYHKATILAIAFSLSCFFFSLWKGFLVYAKGDTLLAREHDTQEINILLIFSVR
jgi:hypothetical protein